MTLPLDFPAEELPAPPNLIDVQMMPIHQVVRYANNPRQNLNAVADVATSIKNFGWRQPLVVDSNHVIVVGDTRYLAAIALGLSHVPVHIARDLTPHQAKAYRIADNKVGERASWEVQKLAKELEEMDEAQLDLMATGMRDYEIEPVRKATFQPAAVKEDAEKIKLPPLQAQDLNPVVSFSRADFEIVLAAVQRCREALEEALTVPEAIKRICVEYKK